jgi:hypothetical protein
MITKETREIDFLISTIDFKAFSADDYDGWKWNISDHKPIELRFDFQ